MEVKYPSQNNGLHLPVINQCVENSIQLIDIFDNF
jgi:hypothetical protein